MGHMSQLPPPPPPPPNGSGQRPGGPSQGGQRNKGVPGRPGGMPRWALVAVAVLIIAAITASPLLFKTDAKTLSYSEVIAKVNNGDVKTASYNNSNGKIAITTNSGEKFSTTGQVPLTDADSALFQTKTQFKPFTPTSSWIENLIPLLLPFILIIGFFIWMQRRAAGQMGNVMSIGRSRAKTYSADKPSTTFADIAGYEGVKQEITEVVDFLRMPERFREIGARVPKGMLLVGPPGTGKTLFARAVAGEAGVGFLSVTGSDFMEMFVGVGASRVRDLFQQARKMGRAIIFVDEIDSIGRKRGAGLGGGHDEREQTLNQMLAEMDGFETSEGIVIMAATNRPDIPDPALLRPGRFD